jgi:glucose/arabinose dehydrogenase
MRATPLLLAASLFASAQAAPAAAVISVERILVNLDQPVFVTSPPDDPRLFIVGRQGTIRIFDGNDVLDPPFLDITAKVDDGGEGGLLGLAFAPDYATSRAFYVYYTADGSGGNPLESRISRFRAMDGAPNTADPAEKVLLRVDQPFSNHNGGTVAFGPDDYLYFGFGDGGDGGDPLDAAQDGTTLLGKMIRLDVAFTNFDDDYAIPGDNPFAGPDGILDEIWAFGLRNPFRFSFDREEGDLYIGDVGQGLWEEIDVEAYPSDGGFNYGWDVREGDHCYTDPDGGGDPGEPACNDPDLVAPVHEYAHAGPCNSVTGGVVYRGSNPELAGHYLFADYCRQQIWSIVWDGAGGTVGPEVDRNSDFAPDVGSIESPVAFGEDAAGEVYIVDASGGEVFLVPEPGAPLLLAAGGALLAARARRRARR